MHLIGQNGSGVGATQVVPHASNRIWCSTGGVKLVVKLVKLGSGMWCHTGQTALGVTWEVSHWPNWVRYMVVSHWANRIRCHTGGVKLDKLGPEGGA